MLRILAAFVGLVGGATRHVFCIGSDWRRAFDVAVSEWQSANPHGPDHVMWACAATIAAFNAFDSDTMRGRVGWAFVWALISTGHGLLLIASRAKR